MRTVGDNHAVVMPRHRGPLCRSALPAGQVTSSADRNAARQAERRLVVYLDEGQRRWVRAVEADALRDDVRLCASAIVRLAIDELRARAVGWRELAGGPDAAGDRDPGKDVRRTAPLRGAIVERDGGGQSRR